MTQETFNVATVLLAAGSLLVAIAAAIVAGLARRDSREAIREARRANDRNDALDRAAINTEIHKALRIVPDTQGRFRFANKSDRQIRDLVIVDPPATLADLPNRFDIPPQKESAHFRLAGGNGQRPRHLMVRWQGLPDAVSVEFPYDPMMSIL